ncbi:unannotated protein [freshwater metagenome]|uniref:Unannotated protein n=1 Tax=freshwater metagenome TaxID=449393 RepID=A0A6J7BB35_9ZZZZ
MGQSHIFSASGTTASDGGTLSYQWESATAAAPSTYSSIAGATGVNYTTPTLAIGDNGTLYRVVVTNAINGTTTAATSSAATLTVAKAPLDPPTAITASTVSGSATSLLVRFTNTSNASSYTARAYLADGTEVGDATTSFLSGSTITGLSPGTSYQITVTAIGNASYSDSAPSSLSSSRTTLDGAVKATITSPSAASKSVGQTHVFSASGTTASDGGTLTYQWQLSTDSATTYSSIAGATGVNYTTPTLAIGDNGTLYRVVVTNAINGTTYDFDSDPATLTVTKIPLAAPTAITPTTVSGSATSLKIAFTNAANATSYTARVYASDGTTLIATATSYTSNTAITGLSAGTAYKVRLTSVGDANYADSSASALSSQISTLSAAAAATITSPTSVSKTVGQSHIFSASGTTASDGGSLTYQWQLSTDSATTYSSIAGATGVNYTTPTLAIGDDGSRYRVVVTNAINGTTTAANSSDATLTVAKIILSTPSQPSGAVVLGSATSLTVTFTNVSNASSYSVQVYASNGTTEVGSLITGFLSGNTITGLTPGTGYKVAVTAIGDAMYANSSQSTLSALITTNKADISTPSAPTVVGNTDVRKYITASWTAVANATSYTLKLYDSSGSSLLATITSVSGTSRAITDSDYASMADLTGYKVTITAIGDTQYANSAESTNSSLVTTRIPDAAAPTINTQPVNTSASSTQTGTLSVSASASDGGTLSYQWQTSLNGGSSWANASSGSGATTSSYTSATLNSTVSGHKYRVVVTNTRGTTTATTTSSAVTLAVIKSNQSALTLTSITGRFTTPTTLTATGGSTNGSLSYAVTSGGTATGCSITTGNLSTGTIGTCRVIATMAGNSEYNSVASDTTTVTFTTAEQSNTAVLSSSAPSIGYGSATLLTVGVATAGTVEFLQEGRTIPGCSSIRATVTTAATCNWKPSRLGATRVEAIFRPTSNAFAQASTNIMSISVIPRG